jgi:hypothetical protein
MAPACAVTESVKEHLLGKFMGAVSVSVGQSSFCLFFFLKTGSCFVVQVGLDFVILLPQPPKCWDYRSVPPCSALLVPLFFFFFGGGVVGIKSRALLLQGKYS